MGEQFNTPRRAGSELLAAITALRDVDRTSLSNEQALELLCDIETAARIVAAISVASVIDVSDRGIPDEAGAGTVKKLLMQTLRLSHAEAGARVAAAKSLGSWHALDGSPREPELPHTAIALADGAISADHARRIAQEMKRIPALTPIAERQAAEEILSDFARTSIPDDIPKVGAEIRAHLDPDGTLTDDHDRQRMRGITIGRQRADGMSPITGEITPTLRALLDPLVAKHARPGMNNPDDPGAPGIVNGNTVIGDTTTNRDALAAAARRDRRSAAQRTHDALLAILHPDNTGQHWGTHRGVPVSTILTMNVADVEKAAGVATTATGGTVPMSEALELAQTSRPFLAVFDHAGAPLHFGLTKRFATREQRMALIATLRGCSRPGCDAPASLCATHHVRDYAKDGPTDITNETLACDACHALIHDGPGGWKTVAMDQHSQYPGRTAWIAPAHIDPTATPKINHRHHAAELLTHALNRIHDRRERERQRHQKRIHRHHPPRITVGSEDNPARIGDISLDTC
ncbi:HNH endonuclease signature motif containing protein [Nocardia callitridis]|uniref:HNH endonuclease signature motif containing protein n=1 Tax=Nocardia callitridis TaxID=648753 RepID=A0ABP9K8D9_9NOCA